MAGVGIGLYSHSGQIADWIHYRTIITPQPDAHAAYEPYYLIYRQLYQDNQESMHRLAQLALSTQ